MRFATKLVHAGASQPRIQGAVTMPVFQSSTFEYEGASNYHDIRYIRLSNTPNHDVLAARLAALEETEHALVAGSGMAAISAVMFALVQTGDHVLAHDCLYGGTRSLLTQDLPKLGVTTSFVDASKPESFAALLKPTTRFFYVETITNPLMEVVELDAVVAFCREHELVSVIDSTLTTPVNFRPATRGFDLVLHSATKYLNGHSDIVAGAVAGSQELVARVKQKLDHFGGILDPHACFLLERGLKTLELRVERQNTTALVLARWLEAHAAVSHVYYPGLASSPGHARAAAWFHGGGGMLSFRLKAGELGAERFTSRVKLATSAPSLGGPETLVTRPASTSHSGLTADERRQLGVTDDLIRVSVGLEAVEDLVDDFEQALG
jgi:cystathionine beta-lyase/cystathionine gamma-synthase